MTWHVACDDDVAACLFFLQQVFRQISDKMEQKSKNMRTLFRKFDENADGTVSQHEFRAGLTHLGIEVTDDEFKELMETIDE
eukprot:COSAG05_NODE_9963_length_590_cov_1.201629_2_plen_81_part_01